MKELFVIVNDEALKMNKKMSKRIFITSTFLVACDDEQRVEQLSHIVRVDQAGSCCKITFDEPSVRTRVDERDIRTFAREVLPANHFGYYRPGVAFNMHCVVHDTINYRRHRIFLIDGSEVNFLTAELFKQFLDDLFQLNRK